MHEDTPAMTTHDDEPGLSPTPLTGDEPQWDADDEIPEDPFAGIPDLPWEAEFNV